MKFIIKINSVILALIILINLNFSAKVNAVETWAVWQNVPNNQGAMFLDNLGDWRWSGNKYTAFHEPGKTTLGNYISWTDFGTGLGEELTNYKVKFKTTRPPDGQGTPGFVIAAQKVDANTFGKAPYQAIAKGFGFPIWYFGDWVGRPGGNTVEWDVVGNPAVGAELIFEIMITPDKFTFSVNGYVIENLNNPPNGGKGYFGLGGQDIQLSPSVGVVFENIQYALPFVAPVATPTSSANPTNSATPTNNPGPTGQATATPVPTMSGKETPSASISTKDITVIEAINGQTVEVSSSSKYPYPGFWEENKQIWLNLQSSEVDNFPELVAPNPDNNPAILGGSGISIDSNQQFYYFDASNSLGGIPVTLGQATGGNGQFGKFMILNGPAGSYTKIMSVLSPSGTNPWPEIGSPFIFGGYYNLTVKIDGQAVTIENPHAVIINWVDEDSNNSENVDSSEDITTIGSDVSENDSNNISDSEDMLYSDADSISEGENNDSGGINAKVLIIALILISVASVGTYTILKKKRVF